MNIEYLPQKKLYTKERICEDCGKIDIIRKDNKSLKCLSCASRIRGEKGLAVIRAKIKLIECKACGKSIPSRLGYTYCSVNCRKSDNKIERVCKFCNSIHHVYKSALSDRTNTSGNFCSRVCYEKWLCNSDRITGRGSQWKKTRNESINLQPFCSLCGTNKMLQVHHIAPFRLSYDNSQENLIVLCVKHHKIVESITHDIELTGSTPDDMKFIIGNILSDYSAIQRLRINANI